VRSNCSIIKKVGILTFIKLFKKLFPLWRNSSVLFQYILYFNEKVEKNKIKVKSYSNFLVDSDDSQTTTSSPSGFKSFKNGTGRQSNQNGTISSRSKGSQFTTFFGIRRPRYLCVWQIGKNTFHFLQIIQSHSQISKLKRNVTK